LSLRIIKISFREAKNLLLNIFSEFVDRRKALFLLYHHSKGVNTPEESLIIKEHLGEKRRRSFIFADPSHKLRASAQEIAFSCLP
jgi:hypothetical protein